MGCCLSQSILQKIPADWLEQFEALKLTKSELIKLFKIYRAIDKDLKGSIDLEELLSFLEIERTSFTDRAFLVFDANGSGKIDFREFILSLWNYCTLTKATLDIFTFDLYDQDTSGELSYSEVLQMVEDLYGQSFHANAKARQIMQELKKIEKTGPFDLKKFSKFARTHQQLLFPAFQIQFRLQEKIMGVSFWEKCTHRRVEWSKGRYATMEEIMEMHMDPIVYSRISHRQAFSFSRKRTGLTTAKAVPSLIYHAMGTLHDRAVAAPEMFRVHEPPNVHRSSDKANKHSDDSRSRHPPSPSRRNQSDGNHSPSHSPKNGKYNVSNYVTPIDTRGETNDHLDSPLSPASRARAIYNSKPNGKVGVVPEDLHIVQEFDLA